MSKYQQAEQFMRALVARTGLEPPSATPRRYLWTDAFAVCNLITLHQQGRGENGEYLTLARKLVDQVHHTLGRHRPDDARRGWLSGLSEEEGAAHPTRGGMRIGKPLSERQAGEPPDRELEWDQDGQYFHYLTKWMHALASMARATGETQYLVWAIELAKAVHPRFTHSGGTRMYWKMSVDLSRPLVSSTGQHDALDALVTYSALRVAAREAALADPALDLSPELADAARMCAKGRQVDGIGQTTFKNRERLLQEGEKLKSYEHLANRIEAFWMKEENRMAKSWTGHENINAVMLATTLAPDAFLEV
uniref:Uncharacterized protein n=1 Tax=Schizophyllum commune (strain H4-8 / FGSC 9210) TaxID=578458 RepID=D8QAG2_SCHCM